MSEQYIDSIMYGATIKIFLINYWRGCFFYFYFTGSSGEGRWDSIRERCELQHHTVQPGQLCSETVIICRLGSGSGCGLLQGDLPRVTCRMLACKDGQSSQTFERGMFRIQDTRWRSCLRHCITNRKVASLFRLLNLSGCTIALGSTKPLTVISISPGAVKAAGA